MHTLLLSLALVTGLEVVDHTSQSPGMTVQDHCVPRRSLEVVVHTLPVPKAKRNVGYTTRSAVKFWYHGGYWPQAKHLNEGEHTGLFDTRWLSTLSPQDLLNLHSDAHEGRVNWEYAFRPGEFVVPEKVTVPTPARRMVQRCINGRCYLIWE